MSVIRKAARAVCETFSEHPEGCQLRFLDDGPHEERFIDRNTRAVRAALGNAREPGKAGVAGSIPARSTITPVVLFAEVEIVSTRFVNCDACGSEGFIEYGHPNAPHADYVKRCAACNGECVVEVEVEPIAEDALWCNACNGPLREGLIEAGEELCDSCFEEASYER